MSDWRQSRGIAATIIVLFIVVQLAIPIALLSGERGQRFGWQMYSIARVPPEFVVTTPEGEIVIDVNDYVPTRRAEIDLAVHLPPHLCEVIPGAETVTWDDGSYEC